PLPAAGVRRRSAAVPWRDAVQGRVHAVVVVQPAVSAAPVIRIVAAVIRDDAGRTLPVRKQGAAVFQQSGGKRDPGDADDLATLARELREELGCELVRDSATLLRRCSAPAANEHGHVVEAE